MKLKNFKSYAFILSLTGSVIVMLNAFGDAFNFTVNEVAITSIVTGILGVLVSLGVVVKDTKTKDEKETNNDDAVEDQKQQNETNETDKDNQ